MRARTRTTQGPTPQIRREALVRCLLSDLSCYVSSLRDLLLVARPSLKWFRGSGIHPPSIIAYIHFVEITRAMPKSRLMHQYAPSDDDDDAPLDSVKASKKAPVASDDEDNNDDDESEEDDDEDDG